MPKERFNKVKINKIISKWFQVLKNYLTIIDLCNNCSIGMVSMRYVLYMMSFNYIFYISFQYVMLKKVELAVFINITTNKMTSECVLFFVFNVTY